MRASTCGDSEMLTRLPPSLLTSKSTPRIARESACGCKIVVRNTFLCFEAEDDVSDAEEQDLQRGARSCMARLLEASSPSFGCRTEEVRSEEEGEEESVAADSDVSNIREVALYEAEEDKQSQATAASLAEDALSSSESRRPSDAAADELLRQPFEVRCGFDEPSNDDQEKFGIEQVSSTFTDELGRRCVSLRLVVGGNGVAVCQNFKIGKVGDCNVRMPSTDSERLQAGALTGPTTALPPENEPEVVGAKSNMVCRHWKLGFCTYEQTCKFLHPIEKQGKKKRTVPDSRGRAAATSSSRKATRTARRPATAVLAAEPQVPSPVPAGLLPNV